MWPFSVFQYSFRSSQSTANLLTVGSDIIARAFNRPGSTWAILLLSMLIILLSNVSDWCVSDMLIILLSNVSDLWQELAFEHNLIYETLWTEAGSGFLIPVLKKLSWFHLTGQLTLLLLMWKRMGFFFLAKLFLKMLE